MGRLATLTARQTCEARQCGIASAAVRAAPARAIEKQWPYCGARVLMCAVPAVLGSFRLSVHRRLPCCDGHRGRPHACHLSRVVTPHATLLARPPVADRYRSDCMHHQGCAGTRSHAACYDVSKDTRDAGRAHRGIGILIPRNTVACVTSCGSFCTTTFADASHARLLESYVAHRRCNVGSQLGVSCESALAQPAGICWPGWRTPLELLGAERPLTVVPVLLHA